MRAAIGEGRFAAWAAEFERSYGNGDRTNQKVTVASNP